MNQSRDEENNDAVMSDTGSDDFCVISISKGTVDADDDLTVQTRKGDGCEADRSRRLKVDSDSNANDRMAITAKPRSGICTKSLEEWVQSATNTQRSGTSFTEMVRRNKNFRNPAIFEKMISYCDIDEFGTELPKDLPLQEHEYYEAIAHFQEECMREKL